MLPPLPPALCGALTGITLGARRRRGACLILDNPSLLARAQDRIEYPSNRNMPTTRTRPARPVRPAVPAPSTFDTLDETHRQIIQVLGQLESLLTMLNRPGDAGPAAALASHVCRFLSGTARAHHEAEETRVFPSLLEGDDPQWLAYVRRLQQDHDWLEEDWLEMEPHLQAIANGYRGDHPEFLRASLPEFTQLYYEHIALEESLVYPEVRRRNAARGTTA
jgi:hemerythrin-like domain-containing protein